jgi:hypothetical protein
MINIQHWPCCQSIMISAALKLELGNLTSMSSRPLGTQKKRAPDWDNTFWTVNQVGNAGLFLELRPEDFHCHHELTLFFSALSWKHHKARECQTLMTKFDDKICLWRTAAPRSCSSDHSTWCVQKYIVRCSINYVICQGDMYTVAKKVILNVGCVVNCK